jgi:two-component system, cell cycle sensor histidine kinase and response regulator CckA
MTPPPPNPEPPSPSDPTDAAAARQAAEVLRLVLDTVPQGVFWKDRDSRYLGVNRVVVDALGLGDPGVVVGWTDADFPSITPAQAAHFVRKDREVMDSGLPQRNIVEPMTLPDGRTIWLSTNKVPLRDADGRVVGILGTWEDITERKRAEDEARDRAARLAGQQAALLELGKDVAGAANGTVRHMTEVTARALGVARVSVWRHTPDHRAIRCLDLYENGPDRHSAGLELSADTYPTYFRALDESDVIPVDDARADPRTREFTAGYLVPLGIGALLDVPLRPFGRVEGVLCCEHVGGPRPWTADEQVFAMAVGGLVSLAQERRERERAEADLRASEQRFRNMADHAPVIVWMTDMAGAETYVNRRWFEFTGQTPAEVSADGWLAVVHPDDRAMVVQVFQAAAAAAGPYRAEFRVRRHDGEYRWMIDTAAPWFGAGGGVLGYIGSAVDVTDHRRAEERLREAAKMEAVGQLAGGVAHDFNNLMTVVNGYSEIILEGLPADDPNRELVAAIRDAGERATRLTQQLLAFGRRQVLEPRVLDLNDLVRDCDRLLRRLIGERIEFVTALDPAPARVRVDPNQVEQVLTNLVANARDAMPTGGRLTIETRVVDIGPGGRPDFPEAAPGRYARLAVTDTGVGMPPEVQTRVFEPFFTTKEHGKGVGLGLATVYGIVRSSGGYIQMASVVGDGTTFEILLPLAADPARPAAAGADQRGTETILLVEDEDGVRRVARLALEARGYRVLAAEGGAAALRLLAGHSEPIDLLVTDVSMPGMSGRELVEAVRKERPGLRVLYVSGYTDDAVVRLGVREATDPFLQKPFTPAALANKVRSVLDG